MAWKNEKFPKGVLRELSLESKEDPYTQIFPFGEWKHPIWGVEVLDRAKAEHFKENFDNKVMGHDITFDYEHKMSTAHGTKAAGKLEELEVRDDGLYGLVKWTPQAQKEIEDQEWLYFSPTYSDKLEVGENTFEDVLVGGGLTNSPVIFGIAPVNCSAIAAIGPQTDSTVVDEYADWEHSEPGTGAPPQPGKTGDNEPAPFYDNPEGDPEDKVDEKALRAMLKIGDDVDINTHLESLMADATAFKDATSAVDMSNISPELKARIEKLETDNRDSAAKAFSAEAISAGVPPVMKEALESAHKKLSLVGGTASLQEVVEALPKVKYDEKGSTGAGGGTGGDNVDVPSSTDEARKKFGAIQTELAAGEECKGDMRKAFSLAAQRHPDLFAKTQEHKVPELA